MEQTHALSLVSSMATRMKEPLLVHGLRRQTDFLTIDSALHERHAAAKTASLVRKARHQSGGLHLDLTIGTCLSLIVILSFYLRMKELAEWFLPFWQSHKGFCVGHRIKEFVTSTPNMKKQAIPQFHISKGRMGIAGLRPNTKQSFASDRPSCMGCTLLSSLGVLGWVGWCILARVQANLAASGKNTMPQADTDVKVEPLLGDSVRRPGKVWSCCNFEEFTEVRNLWFPGSVFHTWFFHPQPWKVEVVFWCFLLCRSATWTPKSRIPGMPGPVDQTCEISQSFLGLRWADEPSPSQNARCELNEKWRVQFSNRNSSERCFVLDVDSKDFNILLVLKR